MGWGVTSSGASLGWGPGKGEVGSRSWIKVGTDSQRLMLNQDRLWSLFILSTMWKMSSWSRGTPELRSISRIVVKEHRFQPGSPRTEVT